MGVASVIGLKVGSRIFGRDIIELGGSSGRLIDVGRNDSTRCRAGKANIEKDIVTILA